MPTIDDVVKTLGPEMASPELTAAREELNTLHTIFGIIKSGTIKAIDWPQAKSVLDYLDAKIETAQEATDALTPRPLAVVPDVEASH